MELDLSPGFGARRADRRAWGVALAALALLLLTGSCTIRRPPPPPAPAEAAAPRERGVASWYGARFHGRKTASGERYDMNAMTAAHRTLPFGTVLRVTNLDNGRSVRVRVNDRGPFHAGRILDLSRAAARRLGMIEAGLATVRIEVLRRP